MRMPMEGMDPSILDLDMNTVGFENIPDGEEVVYPDGHVEPCCKPDDSVPVSVSALQSSVSLTTTISRQTVVPKSGPPKEDVIEPRPKYKHTAKLRPLYWDKLTAKKIIEKSMWYSLDDRNIKLDTAMLDSEFTTKQITFVMPVEPVETSKVSQLLDGKREQNVGIAIGRLKVDVKGIHRALLFADFNILTRDIIQQLCNSVPTPEEQAVCLAFQGDESTLSKASRFVYELSDIPNVEQRCKCCKTIITFDEEIERLQEVMSIYDANQKMVKNSAGLKKLMEIILALGNYLNGESDRGGAWGFRISLLTKLGNTKTADNSKTLLT